MRRSKKKTKIKTATKVNDTKHNIGMHYCVCGSKLTLYYGDKVVHKCVNMPTNKKNNRSV